MLFSCEPFHFGEVGVSVSKLNTQELPKVSSTFHVFKMVHSEVKVREGNFTGSRFPGKVPGRSL